MSSESAAETTTPPHGASDDVTSNHSDVATTTSEQTATPSNTCDTCDTDHNSTNDAETSNINDAGTTHDAETSSTNSTNDASASEQHDTAVQPTTVTETRRQLPAVADLNTYVTYNPAAGGSVQINCAFVDDLERQWGKPPAYDDIYPALRPASVGPAQAAPSAGGDNVSEPASDAVVNTHAADTPSSDVERIVEGKYCCTCNCVVLTIIVLAALYIFLYLVGLVG